MHSLTCGKPIVIHALTRGSGTDHVEALQGRFKLGLWDRFYNSCQGFLDAESVGSEEGRTSRYYDHV